MKKILIFFCILFWISSLGIVFNQEVDTQTALENIKLAGKHIISISPTAFQTHYVLDGTALDLRAGPDEAYFNIPDGNIRAQIPINLPHGSTVTKFAAIFYDNSGNGSISITLQRRHMSSGQIETLGMAESSNAFHSSARQIKIDSTIANALVKNNLYTYHIKIYTYETTDALLFNGAVIAWQQVSMIEVAPDYKSHNSKTSSEENENPYNVQIKFTAVKWEWSSSI